MHILFKFVQWRFVRDGLSLKAKCIPEVERALGNFARELNMFNPSVATSDGDVRLLKHCNDLDESAMELILFVTHELFKGYQKIEQLEPAQDVIKWISQESAFLGEIAIFALESAPRIYKRLIKKCTG